MGVVCTPNRFDTQKMARAELCKSIHSIAFKDIDLACFTGILMDLICEVWGVRPWPSSERHDTCLWNYERFL